MEVILSQDVTHVGRMGQVIKVKDGYARNYLFPRKLAYVATPSNLRRLEKLEKTRNEQFEKQKQESLILAEKLAKASCTVAVEVNDLDKLYGSVTETEIVKALETEGFSIDKKIIQIEKPLTELGIFEIGVKLHPEVVAKVRVWVTKK
jgi:large subunit ribosomal protein L9